MTPFWMNYKYHPTMQLKPPKDPCFSSQVQVDSWMADVEGTHEIFWEHIMESQERQTKYPGGHEMISEAEDKV
jgi:hypothetical protein